MAGSASLVKDKKGATAIEYGLVAGLIAMAAMVAMTMMAGEAIDMWGYVSSSLDSAS